MAKKTIGDVLTANKLKKVENIIGRDCIHDWTINIDEFKDEINNRREEANYLEKIQGELNASIRQKGRKKK